MIFLTDTNNPIAVPAMKEGVTTMSGGKISSYEDDDTLYNYYVFDAAGDIVSFLETDKASGKMVQHVYTKTGNNLYAAPAGSVDYDTRNSLFGDVDPTSMVSTDIATRIDESGILDTWLETTEQLIPIAAIVDGVLIPE